MLLYLKQTTVFDEVDQGLGREKKNNNIFQRFFIHLMRVVPARSALFEKFNGLFSTKNTKNLHRLRG